MSIIPDSQFDQTSASFLAWFQSLPGASFHPSLEIQDLRARNAGRGIIAKSDIPPDTDLFTIPRTAIISIETSDLAKKIPDLFNQDGNDLRDDQDDEDKQSSDLPATWLDLILTLLYEFLQGPSSRWHSYLSILPSTSSSFNTLMFWTNNELAALQASAISNKIGRDKAEAAFRSRILPIVKAHSSNFYPPETPSAPYLSDDELIAKCHIIGSLIMSYAFDLQPDEDDEDEQSSENEDGWIEDRSKPSTMGMVPMADMLNADAEFNAHLSHGDDALTMTSLRTIKAGEEVLNYYGPLPNAELARRYGYTSPKHARYDVVEISWSLVRNCLIEELSPASSQPSSKADLHTSSTTNENLEKLLDKLENDEDTPDVTDGFLLDCETGDPNEEGLCLTVPKFTRFPEDLTDLLSEVISGLVPHIISSKSLKAMTNEQKTKDLKRRTLQVFKKIVTARLAEYGTTSEQDEEMLAWCSSTADATEDRDIDEKTDGNNTAKGSGLSSRMKMALDIRLGEKRLLHEALDWTENMLVKYTETKDSASQSKNGKHTGSSDGKGKKEASHRGSSQGQPPSKKQKRGR